MPHAKGDVRLQGEVGGEAKFTRGKSFSLKLSEIMKIRREAQERGEDWAMQVEFIGQGGQSQKFAVISWNTYVSLRNEIAQEALRRQPKNFSMGPATCGKCNSVLIPDGTGNLCCPERCQ